jgi:dTDP-4-amino-4,6-dideoxygalactose transaminase
MKAMRFPFFDLAAQYDTIRDEVTEAVLRTLESQKFILGPEVAAFEKEIAEWNSSRFAIGCASGSDALLLALMALDIQPGDEVITTPFTFVATVGAIVRLGAKPVFVDIDPATYNLAPALLAPAITPRTKAVIPVHLFGLAADMDPILEICEAHRIPVVEDAAQAIGATYKGRRTGNLGTIGCFSFYPTKNLGAAGDAGLLTTNDEGLADRLRVLANHGSRERYNYETVGINSRLDSLQAAILRVKLRHLKDWEKGRQRIASRYAELVDVVTLPPQPEDRTHVFHQFTMRTQQRDELRAYLTGQGIPTEIYYPSPLHLQTGYAYLGHTEGDFPESERAAKQVLSLPIYPELEDQNQQEVLHAILKFHEIPVFKG